MQTPEIVVVRTVGPVYRGLRDMDLVPGFVIAVDSWGDGYLLKAPDDIDPEFFKEGPLLFNIPIVGMTQQHGVYAVELTFMVHKGFVHGERRQWADEVEWMVAGYFPYDKPIERPF